MPRPNENLGPDEPSKSEDLFQIRTVMVAIAVRLGVSLPLLA
jgi:hypothetical protein